MSTEDGLEYISNLTHEDSEVRKSAAIALGEFGNPIESQPSVIVHVIQQLHYAMLKENDEGVKNALQEAEQCCRSRLDPNLCWTGHGGVLIRAAPYMTRHKWIPGRGFEDRQEWLEKVRDCRNRDVSWMSYCSHGKWLTTEEVDQLLFEWDQETE